MFYIQTLDALPSHLLTPFNGPVPPANVLDKISRSIIHAKDPLEWPHSIRSTRLRLLNLARGRAEEIVTRERGRGSDLSTDVLQLTTNVPKKPLYRQSSMDFLKDNSLNHEKSIDRYVFYVIEASDFSHQLLPLRLDSRPVSNALTGLSRILQPTTLTHIAHHALHRLMQVVLAHSV